MVGGFVLGMPIRRTNNFPESGRGLGHVTPTIFGSTVGYPSDSLASCLFSKDEGNGGGNEGRTVPPRSVNPEYEPRALYSRLFHGRARNCHWFCMRTAERAHK